MENTDYPPTQEEQDLTKKISLEIGDVFVKNDAHLGICMASILMTLFALIDSCLSPEEKQEQKKQIIDMLNSDI